jgi:SAM-dependent methyltransferase
MTALAERLLERYFRSWEHPYVSFEREVGRRLHSRAVVLDAGCGRTAPILSNYRGKAARLIGIDLVEFPRPIEGLELYRRDLSDTGLPDETVDIIMCRSVIEHIEDPARVYAEFARILKPSGSLVFLTANFWDYASLIAAIVPNRFHPRIVARVEGRAEEDVFPIRYRSNTRTAIRRWAAGAGLQIERFSYLGQYPGYFMFNGALFFLASWYEKLLAAVPALHCLRGWILCTLVKPCAVAGSAAKR